jgi:hypothetical protein
MQQELSITHINLLSVLIEINQWENCERPELQTVSGRDLYFRVAAGLLSDPEEKQNLKLLSGRITDRATRSRMRDFEALGLIRVVENNDDGRTRRAVPTSELIARLNQHADLFHQLCSNKFLMIHKT